MFKDFFWSLCVMTCEKVNCALLGAGRPNIATNQQLPASYNSGVVKVAALCDISDGVYEYGKKYDVQAYTDYNQVLANNEIDMIQVATPDQFHCEHATMALTAGKHVLLQKPPCLSLEELAELRKTVEKSACRLKVILNQRHTLLSRSIKNYLDQGVIGELREIIIKYRGRRFPVGQPGSFYLKKESGGVWLHNSLHWLDEAFFYSEILPTGINVCSTKNENGSSQYLGEGPNYWSAVFPMDKVTFLFEYNTMLLKDNMPGGMQRVLIGTEGEIRQNYGSNDLVLYRKGVDKIETLPLLKEEGDIDSVIKSFQLAIDDFAKEIVDGLEREPKINDTLNLFELLLKGLK